MMLSQHVQKTNRTCKLSAFATGGLSLVCVLGSQAQLVFSHDTSCVAGTPFKLGSTLYCEEPRMQRQDLAGD